MILKEWLEKNEMTVYRFCKNIKCSPSIIYHYFSGRNRLSPKTAEKVEKLTNGEVSLLEAIYPEKFQKKEDENE